jgi:hypothetical protein
MTPFKTITKPVSVDFFTICEVGGKKCIHIHGYTYESDEYWANMEACGIVLPLSEFLTEAKSRESVLEYVDELYQEANQYQGDYTAEGIVEVINHYYRDIVFSVDEDNGEGAPEAYLDFAELTMDTPYGEYVTTPLYEKVEL